MNHNDAAKILGLDGDINPEMVKKAYRLACAKYHPDRNPAGLEMMKAINVAYDTLKDITGNVENSDIEYSDKLNDAINSIINLDGLNIEVCGSWVWVSGNTKPHKDIIKEAGYKWASKKKMWYFRPEDYKSRSRGKFSIDDIRNMHGSVEVKTKPSMKIK